MYGHQFYARIASLHSHYRADWGEISGMKSLFHILFPFGAGGLTAGKLPVFSRQTQTAKMRARIW